MLRKIHKPSILRDGIAGTSFSPRDRGSELRAPADTGTGAATLVHPCRDERIPCTDTDESVRGDKNNNNSNSRCEPVQDKASSVDSTSGATQRIGRTSRCERARVFTGEQRGHGRSRW